MPKKRNKGKGKRRARKAALAQKPNQPTRFDTIMQSTFMGPFTTHDFKIMASQPLPLEIVFSFTCRFFFSVYQTKISADKYYPKIKLLLALFKSLKASITDKSYYYHRHSGLDCRLIKQSGVRFNLFSHSSFTEQLGKYDSAFIGGMYDARCDKSAITRALSRISEIKKHSSFQSVIAQADALFTMLIRDSHMVFPGTQTSTYLSLQAWTMCSCIKKSTEKEIYFFYREIEEAIESSELSGWFCWYLENITVVFSEQKEVIAQLIKAGPISGRKEADHVREKPDLAACWLSWFNEHVHHKPDSPVLKVLTSVSQKTLET